MEPTLPTSITIRVPRMRGVLRAILLVALGVGLALGGAGLLRGGGHESHGGVLKGPSAAPFTLRYPASWKPLSKDEARSLPRHPIAAVRRRDKTGLVAIHVERARAGGDLNRFAKTLAAALKKGIPDFQGRSAKLIKVRSGKAFYLSYLRNGTGTLHSLVIVPAGAKTYTLTSVSNGRSAAAAREIGRMIRSFGA
jgi:hypothetical protein